MRQVLQIVTEATLVIDQTIFTTLDDVVKALTSGMPTTLPDFEGKLSGKLAPAVSLLPPAPPIVPPGFTERAA
ncbi:MAG: hypothetical protein E5W75_06885 [Mesorhizobium sp.]|nr:MAG: hypothetical protein E5W75_06885 [Mesorhizobium sp.]